MVQSLVSTPFPPSSPATAGSPPSGRPRPTVSTHRDGTPLAELAAAAAQGDRRAFDQIHHRLTGGLHKLFMERTGNRVDAANDLCQRTWLAVWESLQSGRYDPARSAITTFIYAVGYKLWLQHLRTTGRPEAEAAMFAERSASREQEDPEQAARTAELLEHVRKCLRNDPRNPILTEEERGIVRASAAGASDRDLARQLRIAASTLNARKQSAFEKIRRFLAQKGFRSESDERAG